MCNALSVAIIQALKDLSKDFGCFVFRKELVFDDPIKELTTLASLGNNIDVLLLVKVLEKLQDVWMIQLLKDVDLHLEFLHVLDLFFRYNFDSSYLLCGSVLAFVDHAEAS
jgi:hypothetical protein